LTDLFTEVETTTPATNPNPDLNDLVGEGKRFKTVDDLLKAKLESDAFIERLKAENAGIRTELSTRQNLEQLMDKINSRDTNNSGTTPSNNHTLDEGQGNATSKSTFSEEDISKLVEEKFTQAEVARAQAKNLETIRTTLMSTWGQDFVNQLKVKASELGVSEDFLDKLARNQPKVFLKLVDAENAPTQPTNNSGSFFSPPSGHNISTNRSQGFSPSGERLKSYYDNLKTKDPSTYWSPSVQNQMHNDAIRLGEKFFDKE